MLVPSSNSDDQTQILPPAAGAELVRVGGDGAAEESTPPTAPVAHAASTRRHIIDVNSVNDGIELDLTGTYAQQVTWGVAGTTTLIIDEPEPLGENSGPSPARVLSAALASCLGASLLFCLRKSKVDVMGLHTTASTELVRNERGRLRVGTITVRLEPVVPVDQQDRLARCVEVFEDYCIVTASVRPSVTVNVSVNAVSPPTH